MAMTMSGFSDRLQVRTLRVAGVLAIALGVMVGAAGSAAAATGITTEALNLRETPSTKSAILATMPPGTTVKVSSCNAGWCGVTYRGYSGYASQQGLQTGSASLRRAPTVVYVPIDPNYPYHAGYYPTADSYYKYPPYAEETSWFYPKRYLLSPRERQRYRYRPHIFSAAEAAAQ